MKLQEKKNAPTLENKSGKKNPKDHPPVLKRRDPTDPNSSGGPQ
jgi:hypothetical protein